jgi:hypothetical protein
MVAMSKNDYKVLKILNRFLIRGSYQPAYMDSPPDHRYMRVDTYEKALDAVDEHKKNGADTIEVFQSIVAFRSK